MTKILIVDDDPVQLRLTTAVAEKGGFEAITATGGEDALKILRDTPNIAVMILDLVMPGLDGLGVLDAMAKEQITCPVIVQTANSSLEIVISAMRQGAMDFFVKPVAPERLIISLRNATQIGELETSVRMDKLQRDGRMQIKDIVSASPAMDRVFELADKAAKSTIPVLLEGETGVGKEVIARAIQGSGERAGKPFITVNCGAIPANLIESTLFGHVKGAFTGAMANHSGKFSEAHGGTLFLDEIGELPLEAQVKLLRVIQEGEVEAVGSTKPQKVNVRLISATNKRLLNLAQSGHFREDLYYRLNVFPIYIPPLRQRVEDIDALAKHFVARLGAEAGRNVLGLSKEASQMLHAFDWPGNVRQLENAIYRALVLTESAYLTPVDFPQISAALRGKTEVRQQTAHDANQAHTANPISPIHIDEAVHVPHNMRDIAGNARLVGSQAPNNRFHTDRFTNPEGGVQPLAIVERDLIIFALDQHEGRMTHVAKALGIGRSTLYRKLKEYDLEQVTQTQNNSDQAA